MYDQKTEAATPIKSHHHLSRFQTRASVWTQAHWLKKDCIRRGQNSTTLHKCMWSQVYQSLPKGTSWAAWVNSEGCPSISVTSRQCLSRHWYLETLITVMGLCQSTRILGLEQKGSPGEGNVNPPQYACWENPRDREAWWATVGCDWAGTHIEMETWPDPTSSRSIVSVAPAGGHFLRAQILSSCMTSHLVLGLE